MSNVSQWDIVDGNNNQTPPDGWPEGMQRSSVNDAARADKGAVARWYQDTNGSLTSGGTGSAYTLTTNSTHAALADQSMLVFQAHAANSASATLNVDTLGAKSIKDIAGNAIAANVIAADQVVAVAYGATDDSFTLLGAQNPQDLVSVIASSRGLIAKYATAATADIDADEIVLKNTSGDAFLAESVNLTVDITASGANGLDTGVEASGTWYYLWVIYNPTTTIVAGLISASSTSPTLPSGYTFSALVGTVRNDSGSDFLRFYQSGRKAWIARQRIFNNQAGSTSYTTASIATAVPPIAVKASGQMGGTANAGIQVAGDANGVGATVHASTSLSAGVDGYVNGSSFEVPLLTAQQITWRAHLTSSIYLLDVSGYEI